MSQGLEVARVWVSFCAVAYSDERCFTPAFESALTQKTVLYAPHAPSAANFLRQRGELFDSLILNRTTRKERIYGVSTDMLRTLLSPWFRRLARHRPNSDAAGESTLIIAGMHRSGTSLAASLLQQAGMNVGSNLLGPAKGNVKGHFENYDFVRFHHFVLESQGFDPDGWTTACPNDFDQEQQEAAAELVRRSAAPGLWGWKDPRTTLFLDAWARKLPGSKFLLLLRAPWEVVDSLYRRGIRADVIFAERPEFAVEVWLNYNRLVLDFCKRAGERCVLATAHRIAEHPETVFELLQRKFRLRLAAPQRELIDRELLHTSTDSHWPALVSHYFPKALALYRELLAREADEYESQPNLPQIDSTGVDTTRSAREAFRDWHALRRFDDLSSGRSPSDDREAYTEAETSHGLPVFQPTSGEAASDEPTVGAVPRPDISVVVPAYNHADYIDRALESVAMQHLPEGVTLELIVVDDGSSDGTAECVEAFASRHAQLDTTLVRQANAGAPAALNRGIEIARGRYIGLLNSDDEYAPGRLETLYRAMEKSGQSFCFTDFDVVDEQSQELASDHVYVRYLRDHLAKVPSYPSLAYSLLRFHAAISTGNMFFTRALFEQVGGFTNLPQCHDWDFTLSTLAYTTPLLVGQKLYRYRLHQANTFTERGADQQGAEDLQRLLAKAARRMLSEPAAASYPAMTAPREYLVDLLRQVGAELPERFQQTGVAPQDCPRYGAGWHVAEYDQGRSFRWTGPELESWVEIPRTWTGDGVLQFDVLHAIGPTTLQNLQIRIENCTVPWSARQQSGCVRIEAQVREELFKGGPPKVRIHFCLQETGCPRDLGSSWDARRLGLAIADVSLTPVHAQTRKAA